MCTIMTIDRDFYTNNKALFDHRTKMDASINRDGFAITMLGSTDKEVVTVQMMNYETAMAFIDNNKTWKRLFLHTRAATTKTVNVFGCHNFKTVGNGKSSADEHWIIQHNGYISGKESAKYLVDSMYLGDMVNEMGIDKTIQTVIKTQSYSNIFFINPSTGEYRVARCYVNSLYTDGNGNYSTKIMGSIRQPVKIMESFIHHHEMKKTPSYSYANWFGNRPNRTTYGAKKWYSVDDAIDRNERSYTRSYVDGDWDSYVAESLQAEDKLGSYYEDPAEAYDRQTGRSSYGRPNNFDADDLSSSEEELIEEMMADEVAAFGDETPVYQEDKYRFTLACKKLGFGYSRKIPNSIYSLLSQEQKFWFKSMKRRKLG